MHGQSTFSPPLIRLVLAFAIGCCGAVACKKPASDAALDLPSRSRTPQAATPPESTQPQVMKASESTPSPQSLAPPHVPSPQEQVEEAVALAAEFDRPGTDEVRRVEVISELAVNGTAAAQQTLTRIYRSTRDIEIKKDVLESLHLIESDDLSQSLLLLREAVAAGQDKELRAVALDALRDVDSPKTIPIWQTLLADRDPEIRDTAKTMIEILAAEANSNPTRN